MTIRLLISMFLIYMWMPHGRQMRYAEMWDSSNRSTYEIEKVHNNILLVTQNDYSSSYSDIQVIKRPTLYMSRTKNIAVENFKRVKD